MTRNDAQTRLVRVEIAEIHLRVDIVRTVGTILVVYKIKYMFRDTKPLGIQSPLQTKLQLMQASKRDMSVTRDSQPVRVI